MPEKMHEFLKERKALNDKILASDNQEIKKFFNLDGAVYRSRVLDSKTKEMLGLVASTVLRCDDCIAYHMIRCVDEGISDEEFHEIFSIALVIGGSITIPHVRYAVGLLDEIRRE
jgi:AhpD family alkylhydroperoxidase